MEKTRKVKKNQITGNELITKSVPSRNAQTNTMCKYVFAQEPEWDWLEVKCKALRAIHPDLSAMLRLQYSAGLRVSEVLDIELSDIARDFSIRIRAKKGSEVRIISGECIKEHLANCKKWNCKPFPYFNRFFIYRAYKKCGVYFRADSSTKMSVTHAPRHLKAQSLKEANFSNEEVGTVLGHKNKENTKRYGKEKK